MKIIRFLAGTLMIISGVWHSILAFQTAESRPPMIAFAIAYLIIGILLLINNSWGIYLGAVLPLAGILAASIKIGWSNFDTSMMILIIIDIIVIISCVLMLIYRKKPAIQI